MAEVERVSTGPGSGVLVVEDDDAVAAVIADAVEEELGVRPTVVASGAAALRSARAAPPGLVLLDLGIGDMDGFAVARALRADPRTAAARIVAVSGLSARAAAPSALLAGCDDYLPKPFALGDLEAALRRWRR